MTIDPYVVKKLPKWHAKRLAFTVWCRLADQYSRVFFEEHEIPFVNHCGRASVPEASWEDTQVTPEQAGLLLEAMRSVDEAEGCVVEVGSWRGVTTRYLATATDSKVVAIDPFLGPLNEVNLRFFEKRTTGLPNVKLRRQTFGEAVRTWDEGGARFIFIDAAHDYANVRHDLAAAGRIANPGAIVALHDTDDRNCAGCRRAVYEQLERFELVTHIPNLVIMRRPVGMPTA
jgi:predicted O-methyltransferase YrrM